MERRLGIKEHAMRDSLVVAAAFMFAACGSSSKSNDGGVDGIVLPDGTGGSGGGTGGSGGGSGTGGSGGGGSCTLVPQSGCGTGQKCTVNNMGMVTCGASGAGAARSMCTADNMCAAGTL